MPTITTDEVMNLKVTALKAELTSKGLSTKGVKAVLQQRLIDHLKADEAAAAATPEATTGMEVEDGPTGGDSAIQNSEIDETTRFQGTVLNFNARRGFGYIIPEGKEESDKIFCHWKQIQSDDKWPSLDEGTTVEYYLGKMTGGQKRKIGKLFAATVSLVGGEKISATSSKTYLDQSLRFSGKVKFFDKKKGFGFIALTEDASAGDVSKSSGEEVYVAREDIELPEDPDYGAPLIKKDQEVEFCLYRDEKASDDKHKICAGEVTGPGRVPIEIPAEERKTARSGPRSYPGLPERNLIHGKNIRGEVVSFRGKFGFIKPTTYNMREQDGIEKDKLFAHCDDVVGGRALEKGQRVEFNIYKDEKGWGATNIRISAGGRKRGLGGGQGQRGGQSAEIGQIVQVQLPNGQIQLMRVAGQVGGQQGGRQSKRQRREKVPKGKWQKGGRGKGGGSFSFVKQQGGGGRATGPGEMAIDLEVEKNYIGGIIGKGGEIIRNLRDATGCQFDISKDATEGRGNTRVIHVTGNKISVAKGLVSLAKNIADQAQSLQWKLTILLPDRLCGRIIGKGGATIKKLRGDTNVNIKIAKQAIEYPTLGRIAPTTIFGGQQDVAGVLGRIVDILASSEEMGGGMGGGGMGGGRKQQFMAQPQMMPMNMAQNMAQMMGMGGMQNMMAMPQMATMAMPNMMGQQRGQQRSRATYTSRPQAATFATAPTMAMPMQMNPMQMMGGMNPMQQMQQMQQMQKMFMMPNMQMGQQKGNRRNGRRKGRAGATTGYGAGGVY